MSYSLQAFPDDAQGNVATTVHRFHLQNGVVSNKGKERAFRVSYKDLNDPVEQTEEGDHIPQFHSARFSR